MHERETGAVFECLQKLCSLNMRILHHKKVVLGPSHIVGVLEEKGITVSRVGVWKFLKWYEEMGELSRKPGSGRPSIIILHR